MYYPRNKRTIYDCVIDMGVIALVGLVLGTFVALFFGLIR